MFMQEKLYTYASVTLTVIYGIFVLCYLVYDNSPSLMYLTTNNDAVLAEYYLMVIPGWRIL